MSLGSGIRDPGSGNRNKPIPDPGSRIQGSKRHRIPDPDPQDCKTVGIKVFLTIFVWVTEGSESVPLSNGSGSRRPKNLRIWIRIRNTIKKV
jgi:hypothetical protein